MLRFLRIRRLAVIDAVDVEFSPGLNVLTGETGAGKSVLVGAVGLLLGGRASGDLVRTGEEAATVEAIFDAGGEELVVRREVTAGGRSRAYINGGLATAAALRDLVVTLVELHGQHEHQTLLDPSTHLGVLDAHGELEPLARATSEAFGQMREAADALAAARRAAAERETRRDAAAFQLAELDRAALRDGEDEGLAADREVLAAAERVQELCAESYASLYESDGSILGALGGVWRRVAELAALDPAFQSHVEGRDAIKSQLEDLAAFLRQYADRIDASPARLQQVEDRLALLERLKRRYGPTLSGVIAKREVLRQELTDLEDADDRVARLEQLHTETRDRYRAAAGILADRRRTAAAPFAEQLKRHLAELAMEQTRFEVRFAADGLPEDRWTAAGTDEAEFFVSPNPGEELRPLARIVSGGELSRIMLSIKTLSVQPRGRHGDRPTGNGDSIGLVFDEVDAGIGGRVADTVGRRLRALGSSFQVLCITHLPQIAAYADAHFHVAKVVEGGRTRTTVARLDASARVDEIGRMLSGAAVTEGIRASALELLERSGKNSANGNGEPKSKGESETAKAKVVKQSRLAAGRRRSR
jgi:DNA repair protein RecN (Recombination protein N)